MLVLANVYDVPELNLGNHFYMSSDVTLSHAPPRDVIDEKSTLKGGGAEEGTKYGGGTGGEGKEEVRRSKKKASKGVSKKTEDQETLVDE